MFCVGRAGRYGSKFLEGAVTCLDKEDPPLLPHSLTDLTRPLEVMNDTVVSRFSTHPFKNAFFGKKNKVQDLVSIWFLELDGVLP